MKKQWGILFIILSLLMAACSKTDTNTAVEKEDKQAITSTVSSADKMNNGGKAGGYRDFTSQSETLTKVYQSIVLDGKSKKKIADSIAVDLNGDGKAELVVLQGLASEYQSDTYEECELVVFDTETKSIVYTNHDLGYMIGQPEKLLAGDFTHDNLAEVKATILSDGTAGASFNVLLSYQGGEYVDLFDQKPFSEGVTTMTKDDQILIALDILQKYYYVPFNNEQKAADELYYGMRHDKRNAVPTGDHSYSLQESYELNGPLSNADFIAKVTVDYRYEDGKFVLNTLSVESMNGMPVTKGERPSTFILDQSFGDAIASGNIPGLGVHIGMTKAEVSALLGKKLREYNYLGGMFVEFEKSPSVGFCFSPAVDPSMDSLYSLTINQEAVTGKTFVEVKELLGTPSSSGHDEMEGLEYISYSYGDAGVTFYGKDNKGPISFMHILYK
ncbi:hypothetical protein [Paenibacillus sp.]|uniref:hypothetical protein n=1 Tax=Paenibacillus sp. TaxID=58172 RepID=UPI0028350FB5|nr:hypothetical protein [Paenibacillus sp.]MDR0267825.1 hypothetical protein [Paenibacillus sp.]